MALATASIVDLGRQHLGAYLCCLEPWSLDAREGLARRLAWFRRMRGRGLVVKLALVGSAPVGMIQAVPVEHSFVQGSRLYVVLCVWVHGHEQGVGNHQRRGIGSALLEALEAEVRARGAEGIAAWGIDLPAFMRASWFRRRGYADVDRDRGTVLLWKPFVTGAIPPVWLREQRPPPAGGPGLPVVCFTHGWCAGRNAACERARRAAASFGGRVAFRQIDTCSPEAIAEWGHADAVFVGGREVRFGPPPSERRFRWIIARRLLGQRVRRALARASRDAPRDPG